ncbi:MAG: beta-ketoacyl synthase [Acidobacteriota bacterium]
MSDDGRRVVITGAGAATSLGTTLQASWQAWVEGKSGLAPLALPQGPLCSSNLVGRVADFEAREQLRFPKALKLMDRMSVLACTAAREALAQAGFPNDADLPDLAISVGSGPSDMHLEQLGRAVQPDPELRSVSDIRFFGQRILAAGLNPLWPLLTLPNMVSAHLAIQSGARGPNSTLMTDWIAGAQAVGEAARLIRNREAETVLAGGAESGGFALTIGVYQQAGLELARLDGPPGTLRGLAVGEAAAMVVLEEQAHALARGARPLAEITGYACASGDLARTLPSCMKTALHGAGWEAQSISWINRVAWPGASLWPTEESAWREVFSRTPAVLELKPRLGHTFAASGALDLVFLLKCAAPGSHVICNCFGRHGETACLAFAANEKEVSE